MTKYLFFFLTSGMLITACSQTSAPSFSRFQDGMASQKSETVTISSFATRSSLTISKVDVDTSNPLNTVLRPYIKNVGVKRSYMSIRVFCEKQNSVTLDWEFYRGSEYWVHLEPGDEQNATAMDNPGAGANYPDPYNLHPGEKFRCTIENADAPQYADEIAEQNVFEDSV